MKVSCQSLDEDLVSEHEENSSCCLHMLNQITADSAVYREMTLSLYADYEQEEESISVSALLFKSRVSCVMLNLRLLAWQLTHALLTWRRSMLLAFSTRLNPQHPLGQQIQTSLQRSLRSRCHSKPVRLLVRSVGT